MFSEWIKTAYEVAESLDENLQKSKTIKDMASLAEFYRVYILEDMKKLRTACDSMENVASVAHWPYPSYGDLLFSVK